MRRSLFSTAALLTAALLVLCAGCGPGGNLRDGTAGEKVRESTALPAPLTSGGMPLDEAIDTRASVRRFSGRALNREEVSQLLWACRGEAGGRNGNAETGATGKVPSAGGLYPLEVYLLEGRTLCRYEPGPHSLATIVAGVDTAALEEAVPGQPFVTGAPAVFVIAADFEITRSRYGDRAERYVWIEAGHAAQNLLLEATALGLGSVPVGAFRDEDLAGALGLPAGVSPLYLVPVGHPEDG